MSFYINHVFFCTHTRDDSKCCANENTNDLIDYAKTRAKELGLTKATGFRISKSGCMGRCNDGPFLVIYPKGDWHKYSTREDIDQILNAISLGIPGLVV